MKNTESSPLSRSQAEERTRYLAEFMMPERFDALCRALDNRTDYMTVLTENMFHPQNASAIVRHCEAFGIQNIHTVENLCPFNPNLNIVRGTDKWIDINRHSSTAEALHTLKTQGYRIVATTPHRESCTPETFDVGKGRFALVFGTEKQGISDEVIASADEFLRIPMCGLVESLNVSASAAILIYILSQRMRREVADWHLTADRRAQLLYRWCRESVKDADGVLERGGW
ncbi:MAG: TrmH family RNA methyltransferase [Alistipes sp.]